MDTGTGLTILGTALGGKDIIIKLLGPSADYLGEGIKDFAKKRVENVKKIFSNASLKLGDKLDSEIGNVSAKVLKGILDEGSYSEDFLSIEYFGGVLASSRTGIKRDDRGAYFNSLIGRLSVYQLRLHYIIYHCIKITFDGSETNLGLMTEISKLRVFISFDEYIEAMDFTEEENNIVNNLIGHSIHGLVKEDLMGINYAAGKIEHIKPEFPSAESPGIIFQPSALGVELFLWAYGKGQSDLTEFLNKENTFPLDSNMKFNIAPKIVSLKKRPIT